MAKIHELIDSLTNDNAEELRETLKAEASALADKNGQLYARAKKAEGFEYDKSGKRWVKKESKPEAPVLQSSEPDYAKLAYLKGEGLTHPDDQKWVMDEAARLKLPLTDILNMAHAKAKLQTDKEQREAEAGMPKGRGKGGGQTQNDVDYWLKKGETPDDQELAEKVIEARMKKERDGNKFSDQLYNE